jgi:hydroxyacylglutathione hydrolase
MFQRFYDEGLAHASYVVSCPRTKQALVVDPRRDIDAYVAYAAQHDLRLTWSVETHIHADFVSGARELTAVGAQCLCGPGSGLGFPHRAVRDGEDMQVGDLRLHFLHTPGHTPEHICILVREPGAPPRLFTGDTLFVGAVGRPDLLGEDLTRRLAGDLHDSLFGKILALDDDIEVHPAHGAGSLCGRGIGAAPSSTIGQERRQNPMLQHTTREDFVAAVLDDLPETPSYFPRMKRVNHDGPALLGLSAGPALPPPVDAKQAGAYVADGAVILDMRPPSEFAQAHPRGAVNIAFGSRIGYWAGWVLPPETRIVLLPPTDKAIAEATRQLLRVGLDRAIGVLAGGVEAWQAEGLPVGTIEQVNALRLMERWSAKEPLTIVDVRTPREWQDGHIDGARHIPVGDLPARVESLKRGPAVATICESGFRSMLAASLLARAGVPSVLNVSDGMEAVRTLAQT